MLLNSPATRDDGMNHIILAKDSQQHQIYECRYSICCKLGPDQTILLSLTPILIAQLAFPNLSDTLMKVVRHKRKDRAF